MKKKTFDRMVKKIHQINNSVLSIPIRVKRLKPLDQQPNYNSKLKEWFGEKEWDVIETTGIIEAFKESEDWRENGMLYIHDFKISINNNIPIDTNCIVEKVEDGSVYQVIFKREYIGENIIGLRPRVI